MRTDARFRIGVAGVVIGILSVVAASTALEILPPFYSAKPVRARVVDAESGRPVQGVVVVAVWELKQISGQGPRLQVSEAVTDAQGSFSIPGFGPKLRPPLMQLTFKSPRLTFFKHGYVPLNLYNQSRSRVERSFPDYRSMPTKLLADGTQWVEGTPYDAIQESMWDGLNIELDPFRGTPEEWFRQLDFTVHTVVWEDAKYVRAFYESLRSERQFFEGKRLDPKLVAPDRVEGMFRNIEQRLKASRRL